MIGLTEAGLLSAAALCLLLRFVPGCRPYRGLFRCGAALFFITALFPRTGNPLGQFLFGTTGAGLRLPREMFGVLWWVLGAWLSKNLLDLALRRTFFPDNDEPHARRLFADLASVLIYILAFVGIAGNVFQQPVSTFLATSGVLAVVFGLALQNTLGDIFSGLAINIEQPFGAGDWISLSGQAAGQVMQVNWRATRLRTWSHDTIVIPNSIISKTIVTNHSRPIGPHRCVIALGVDATIPPPRVIAALLVATAGSPALAHGTAPQAYACAFMDGELHYELAFALDSFALTPGVRSDMLGRIAAAFQDAGIRTGPPATDVRLVQEPPAPPARA